MKGTIRTFLVLFVVIAVVAGIFWAVRPGSGGTDAEQLLHEVTIEAEVLENGDMRVSERWDLALYDRGRSYRNLYKTFPGSREQEVTDFTVTDNETGEVYAAQGTFGSLYDTEETAETSYIVASRSETELGWYIPPTNEGEVSYTLSYTVTNAVERYDDVGVLYHGFIGSAFTIPIESFTATVTLPDGAAQGDLRGWLHCTAESFLTIESGSRVTMTAQDVPAETMIETRICAPSSLFPDAVRVQSGSALEEISAEEQQWADEWEAQQARERFWTMVSIVTAAVSVLAGLGLGVLCRVKKRRHRVESPDYYRELPSETSPGGAASLFYYYDGGIRSGKIRSRVAAATMMNLARKGWIAFEENPYGASTKDKDDDVLIRVLDEAHQPLTMNERCLYDLLYEAAYRHAQDGTLSLDGLEAYAKRRPQKYQNAMERFLNLCQTEIEPRGWFEREQGIVKLARLLGVLAVLLAVVLFAMTDGWSVVASAGLTIGAILLFVLSAGKTRLSETGETELGEWNGLKRYLLDFSNMKEYGVFQLPLWEEYLVYAAMMGISEEVAEQLKKAYPQVWAAEGSPELFPRSSYLYWMYYRPMYYHRGPGLFAYRLANTMENASRAAQNAINAMQSKSSGGHSGGGGFGGGGFGGGGGGFGSGGGGGAR